MFLAKDSSAIVYEITNEVFEQVGMLNNITSMMGSEAYIGAGDFAVWATIGDESNDLLQKGRYVWFGGDAAGKIEDIAKDIDEDGNATIKASGRTLECILNTRVVWDTLQVDGVDASTAMMTVVNANCVSPVDPTRKIPWLELGDDIHAGGSITMQQTGSDVYGTLEDIAKASGLGFKVTFDPYNKRCVFEVVSGVDRSQGQSANDPVIFTTDLEDVLSSSYSLSTVDYRNVAIVDGEGEGIERKRAVAGDQAASGFDRVEMYVDARDIQSTYTDDNGDEHTLTDEQYTSSLVQRGDEKLSQQIVSESLESSIRVDDKVQFKYEKDYWLGDKVTVIDTRLLCSVDAIVNEAEESMSDEYELVLSFGYQTPTLLKRIRKGVV